MSSYQILIPDMLLAGPPEQRPVWPDGLTLFRQAAPGPAGTHWHEVHDPDAPAGLEGRKVTLTLRRDDDTGKPVITARRLVRAHQPPADGADKVPCCGTLLWEIPHADSIAPSPDLADCDGEATG